KKTWPAPPAPAHYTGGNTCPACRGLWMASPHATLLRHIALRAAASVPDAVLLRRFVVSRDEDAFAGLVRRHGAVVYRVCHGLLGPTAADDAFQTTFLVLATRAAAVRKAGS